MKQIDKLNMIHSDVKKDYKPKMVKGRTGWLVKGFVFATLLGAGSLATISTDEVQAAEWKANTAEMIRAKIKEGDTSYTFAEGDTFYEIGRAINVKYTVLMELNGFAEGTQYTVPVGTTITFDGRKVTLTDKEGNVVKEQILSDKDKVDTSKTFMNQKSDDIKSTNTGNRTNGGSTNGGNGNGGTKPNPTNPVKPVEPTNPVTPVDPTDPTEPTDPIKPIEPTDPELSELEKLKAYLAELEAQLVVAKQELATAEQNLLNAKNGANVDYDTQIAELEVLITDKLAQQAIVGDEIIALEGQQIALQGELVTAQNELANVYASRNEAQEAVNAAQAALEAIQSTEDAEQIANAETALASAQIVLNEANQQVSNAESVVNEKENTLTSVDSSIVTKQEQLASLDTLEDSAKLAELKAQKDQQENNQQSIAELEKIVAEKQKVVSDLEAKIEETKQKIAAIELKVERANAINTINGLEYLSHSSKNTYTNQVNSALNTETINAIVQAAINENNMLKDEHEAAEALKKAKADAIKTVSALEYLEADGKADYIAIIESAENIETINAAVSNAQVEDAKIKAECEANKELDQAKENAKAEISKLEYLSAESKTSYKNQISDAKTIEEIAPIVDAAKAENAKLGEEQEAAKKLAAAKAEAIGNLEELNLTDAQKADFTAQINAATTVEAITPIVAAAKVQSNKNDEAASAKELQEAKDAAKAEIAKMNLTAAEKAKFSKDVDNAKTISEVKSVTAKAQEQATKNTEAEEAAKKLVEAKANAKTEISKMNLTADEKSAFEKQIDEAKTIAEITPIVEAAKVQSDKNTAAEEDAKKLAEAKTNAKAEISKMNLTDAERNEFNSKVDNASTIAGVNSVVSEAQAQSDKNSQTEEDAKKLAEAKAKAKSDLDGLNLKDAEHNAYLTSIDNAKTIEEVNAIVKDAQATSKVNDEEDAKEETAKKLAEAKKEALGKIDKMNLKADEKTSFTKQINEATTIEQVNQIVTEAQKTSDYNDANPVKKTTVTFIVQDKYGNAIDTIVMDAEGDTYSFTKEELGLGEYEIITGENLLSGKTSSQEGGNKKIRLVVQGPSIKDDVEQKEKFDDKFDQNLNDVREETGLKSLENNQTLNDAAQARAKDLAKEYNETGDITHTKPDDSEWHIIMGGADVSNSSENIAMGGYGDMSGEHAADKLFNDWLNSKEGHKEIMMSEDIDSYGVGFYYDETTGRTYAVFLGGSKIK